MKHKWLSILPLGLISLTCISTSCSAGVNQLNNIINNVNANFIAPSINLGKVNSIDEAKSAFTNELLKNSKTRLDEILFDLFNFLGADGFTIKYDEQTNKSLQILPNDYNFVKLYNNKKCVINTKYDYEFILNNDSKNFTFIFKGFLNIQMIDELSSDNIKLKKGDMIQFIYDIESWMKIDVDAIQNDSEFIAQLQYSYTESNDIKESVGLIKLFPLNGDYYRDFAICNIDDINFTSDNHHILKCSK